MSRRTSAHRFGRCLVATSVAAALSVASAALAHQEKSHAPVPAPAQGAPKSAGAGHMEGPAMANMRMPHMDPVRGRQLFVSKGCVACHAVNGVGGHDAVNLDAHTMQPMMNPFEFAAKMWRMAPYMIAAQEEALGEQILFTGEELADIIAFVHDDEEQHRFFEADIPPDIMALMHHDHGETSGKMEHAEELGHAHAEGEPQHSD